MFNSDRGNESKNKILDEVLNNHIRIHGTLGYLSPIEYKNNYLKKVV